MVAVAAGGAIGAACRHALTLVSPDGPAAILAVNVLGCFLMGVLLSLTDPVAHRRRRAFLGTGVLGGFTTVSTYAVLAHTLWQGDRLMGLGHLVLTPLLAVAAAGAGAVLTRRLRRAP